MLNDKQKAQYFRALMDLDLFEAQFQLEDELYANLASKMLTLPMEGPNLDLEYAKVRGALEVLKQLKAVRERLKSSAVEKSTLNS